MTLWVSPAALVPLLIVSGAALASSAPCGNTTECVRLLAERQRATWAVAARFEQTKHLSLLTEPLVTRGRFAFKQPDLVIWEIDDPPTTLRIDGSGVHLQSSRLDKGDVAAVSQVGSLFRTISGLFTGALGDVERDFTVEASGDAETLRVHLVPRRPEWQRIATAIDMTFAGPASTVQSFHLQEPLGDRLDVVFSDVRRNDEVPAALFDPPPTAR